MKKKLLFFVLIISLAVGVSQILNIKLFGRDCSPCFIYFDAYSQCDSYCKSKGRGGCSTVRLVSATCAAAPYFSECNIAHECICMDNSCRIGGDSVGCSACVGDGGGSGFEDIPGDYGNWHDPNWY